MTSPFEANNNPFFEKWEHTLLTEDDTLQNAISKLDEVALQILLIVDSNKKLIGTLSDGDIRRGLLKGLHLQSTISTVVFRNPLVVPQSLQRDLVLKLMTVNKIRQIPIVDDDGKVIGLHLWDLLAQPKERENTMVIMAGGRGTRMRPFTEDCPKPMLHVAGKPMLEHIILHAKAEGFKNIIISINYLGDIIEDHFGDGSNFGLNIHYIRETKPLGTAGGLYALSETINRPFVVTNGDVMTNIRYGELLDFHIKHEADATMAVRLHEWQHPFGVVQMDGIKITGIKEKPITLTHINAGVYVLSPSVLRCLVKDEICDMPNLFERIWSNDFQAIAYPMYESWMDVGKPNDLLMVQNLMIED